MTDYEDTLDAIRLRLERGEYDRALADAEDILSESPGDFDARQLRARLLFLLGRDDEALEELRAAGVLWRQEAASPDGEDAHHNDPWHLGSPLPETLLPIPDDAYDTLLALRSRHTLDPDLLSFLARVAEDLGNYEVAAEVFGELIDLDADNRDAWEGLIHVLSHRDLNAAANALPEALRRFPRHPLFHEYVGFLHARRHEFKRALVSYARARSLGGEHPDIFEAIVECHLALDDTAGALRTIAEEVAAFPDDPEAWRFAVDTAVDCEDHEAALSYAHQLVRLEPSRGETYAYKALAEIAAGDRDAAERTLRYGVRKAADGPEAVFSLGDMLIEDGDPETALFVADLARELFPEDASAWLLRGRCLQLLGDFPEALGAFRQAAFLDPHGETHRVAIGSVLAETGEYDQALQEFDAVLHAQPDHGFARISRGLCYLAMGGPEQAYRDFDRAAQDDPEEGGAIFWRGVSSFRLGNVDVALRDLRRALDISDLLGDLLENEESLDDLRQDPRVRALLDPPVEE